MREYNTAASEKLYGETKKYLLNGVASSFHKAPYEDYALFLDHGKGSKVYDADGNEYIDYVAGMGPMILGYCPESVNRAVWKQLQKGTQFAASTPELLKFSRKLTEIIPCAELVACQSTGTEANMLAFRFARAYTGRKKIVKFEGQYHGWSDEEKVSTDAGSIDQLGPRDNPWKVFGSAGQREEAADDILLLPWNDAEALEQIICRHGSEIAAVITEPFMCDAGPIWPKDGYLRKMRELTAQNGIVLIFDEVITGFRMALGGAQEYFGVKPDLAVFAKAIAAGYSISVVAGRRDIMESGVVPSGTFNANPVAVAAANATIAELEQPRVYERMQALGDELTDGFRKLGQKHGIKLYAKAAGSICMLLFGMDRSPEDFRDALEQIDHRRYDRFVRVSLKQGVRYTPLRGRIYLSAAHTEEDIQKTLEAADSAFSLL